MQTSTTKFDIYLCKINPYYVQNFARSLPFWQIHKRHESHIISQNYSTILSQTVTDRVRTDVCMFNFWKSIYAVTESPTLLCPLCEAIVQTAIICLPVLTSFCSVGRQKYDLRYANYSPTILVGSELSLCIRLLHQSAHVKFLCRMAPTVTQ